jgi:hypothetical protein
LPDGVYLVNIDGTLEWSGTGTSGSSWTLGKNSVVGGLTWACDGSDLEVTVDITGFTGGSPVVSPCTLTASPLSLGNWTFTRSISTTCPTSGATYSTEETATIALTVASWLDGADPATGVQSIAAGIAPPYDATGPWKTEAEAINCCGEFITEADLGLDGESDCTRVCDFNVRRSVKGVMRLASTGAIIAQTARVDLVSLLTGTPPYTSPNCTTNSVLGTVSPIPGCADVPTDLNVGLIGTRTILGTDTFSTPRLSVAYYATLFSVYSSVVPSAGWDSSSGSFRISLCGQTGFLQGPTKAGTLTMGPTSGTCSPINVELWIEPA